MKKYVCDVCGRPLKKKISLYGQTLCSKHRHQILKYGHPLDTIQRTNADLNEFRYLDENTIQFDVYNQRNAVVGHFLIDVDDLDLVRYHKWRKDTYNCIVTGNCTNTRPRQSLSRLIMNCTDPNKVVDHINGDHTDNRKQNLRICTQAENMRNRHLISNNTSGEIGVSWDKARHCWAPEIRCNGKRWHLGRYSSFEEAKFVRLYAEKLLFREFQCKKHTEDDFKSIPRERQKELQTYVETKLGNQLCRGPKSGK